MAKQKLFLEDAKVARDAVTKSEMKRIQKLYEEWAKEIGKRADYWHRRGDAFQERYYKELRKQLQDGSQSVSKALYTGLRDAMYEVSDSVMQSSAEWLSGLGFNHKSVSAAMSNVARQEVTNIINGRIYDTGWSLSKSIWGSNDKTLRQLYQIVGGGVARNDGIYEIAKQLEQYVNPFRARPWNLKDKDGRKIYPRQVDYNAQRLARTLVQHAYQQSVIGACKANPFTQKIRWVANGSRVCEICKDRDGRVYDINDVPLDHPNGMCVMEPVVASDEEINERLANWVAGGADLEIDAAVEQYGYRYGD